VSDPRNPKKIIYPLSCLLFTAVMMYLCRLGSRREINHQFRGNLRSAAKFQSLFHVECAPHGDTLNYSFKRLEVEEVQEIVCRMVETLVRKKVLYPYRLLDRYFMIAIDGSGIVTFYERHCEHCLTRKLNNGMTLYYHPVLEAKLVTANGFAFSLMTEFIENTDLSADKQDCELKAFYRLAPRLKARFPRLPICLLLDSLFANGPSFSICEAYGWKYLINLKDDSLPSVNQEFESLSKLESKNRCRLRMERQNEKIEQNYCWANDIYYRDSKYNEHSINVLECLETTLDSKGESSTTKYKWVTNFNLNAKRVIPLANNGGRKRWKIENEGFNIQKNGGFELEHPYSENENARKIFYLLLQIAYTIFQLIEKGSLFKQAFPNGVGSLQNIAKRLLEAWRNLRLNQQAISNLGEGKFQIRFDTS
jgi:hypothetical protein